MSDGHQHGLDAILGWNAVKVARLIGAQITSSLAEQDLSLVQFGVLSTLASGDEPLTTAEIARAVFVRPQTMAEVLDGMERRALISRLGTRARGRRNPVVITDTGRSAFDQAYAIALRTNDLSGFGLTPDDSRRLNALLTSVIDGDTSR
ncbi:MarR family winged helix-turn-helix transcriptional regulator [Microbacterium sp. M1A1_1b]